MQRQLTDEQLNTLLMTLLGDAGAGDATVEEAASSPGVWWKIQGQIKQGRDEARSTWPPALKSWRWICISVSATAAAFLIALYSFPISIDQTVETAAMNPAPVLLQPGRDLPAADPAKEPSVKAKSLKPASQKPNVQRINKRPAISPAGSLAAKDEIKSEFISLSYAREADSGQIVRVKVPSSMLVTVGLVASVEKPSALIDAEVLVGDDGLTRAIRFIR